MVYLYHNTKKKNTLKKYYLIMLKDIKFYQILCSLIVIQLNQLSLKIWLFHIKFCLSLLLMTPVLLSQNNLYGSSYFCRRTQFHHQFQVLFLIVNNQYLMLSICNKIITLPYPLNNDIMYFLKLDMFHKVVTSNYTEI